MKINVLIGYEMKPWFPNDPSFPQFRSYNFLWRRIVLRYELYWVELRTKKSIQWINAKQSAKIPFLWNFFPFYRFSYLCFKSTDFMKEIFFKKLPTIKKMQFFTRTHNRTRTEKERSIVEEKERSERRKLTLEMCYSK